jgi:hypothetical protein
MAISCINVVGLVTSPNPQSGINNVFGAQVYLDYWPVDENVIVTGYLRDDDNITNIYEFNLTINTGAQSAETLNNVLICGPTATASIFITGVTPTTVTYTGTSYPICGYEITPTPTSTEPETPTPTPTPNTTPTPTPVIILGAEYSAANAFDACNAGLVMTNIGITGGSFCDATSISCDEFLFEIAGVQVWIAFGGQSREALISDPNVDGSATFVGACTICVAPPTPTPTPDPTPPSTPPSTPASTPASTPNPTPDPTPNPTPSIPALYYQIFDCNDSSVGFSIAYTAGAFTLNERCTAVNILTKTVIVIGSTSTLPGGPLYTLTSLGETGCGTTPTPTPNVTPSPTPDSTPPSTPTQTPTPDVTPTPTQLFWYYQGIRCGGSEIETFRSTSPLSVGSITIFGFCAACGGTNQCFDNIIEVFTPTTNDLIGVFDDCTCTTAPTPPQTPTQTETPTQTPSETATQTPSQTETPTQTPSQTVTQTPSQTETPTQTPSQTETQTPTPDPTQTSTPSMTPTNTTTQTQTPTPSPTLGFAVQFVDCSDNTNVFRFNDPVIPSTIGVTYYITGSTSFSGCATTVVNTGDGPQYNGTGVSFQMTSGGCGDAICPRASNRAALLTRCSDGLVFYFNVEEDTAFVGAAYVYDGVCYSFVEFSGPGGDSIGSPLYQNCIECLQQPTPSATPYVTPTNTPTVSATPPACSFTTFCLSSPLSSLSNYNGNYTNVGVYNGKPYYEGDGITTAYIYYFIGSSEYWCLSDTLGGTCILQGASPCYSQCPDILANGFTSGICPTPTPTPIDCNTFNFNAYFDCDWEPLPTPTPSIACDDVNFDIGFVGVTPTPTPTGIICDGTAVSFSMSGFTPQVTPTVTLTPSVTLTRTVEVQGQATFNMLDETFNCVSVKVLKNCNTNAELYTSSNLSYDGITVVTGMTFFASINDENVCVTYVRDDSNFSSNSIVSQIFQIYSNCANCSNLPTPTPSTSPTATQTLTPTPSATPTQTSTPQVTSSPTSTVGSTPTQTQTSTQTVTPTNSPTPSVTKTPTPTPLWVYVYESCQEIPFGKFTSFAQVIQTQQISFALLVEQSFKDSEGNCWVYNGRFEADYIAPPTMTPITYQGNYFANAPETIFDSCDDCLTPIVVTGQTVISVGASMEACVGGTGINDFMGAYVILDLPVTVETTIEVNVYFQYGNSYLQCIDPLSNNLVTSFSITIPVGGTYGQVDACTQGQYFSTGANICGTCVSSSDNPNINFGSFGC